MGLLLAVHFEAKRLGLKGLAPENIPNAVEVLKNQGHLVIPLVVLIGMIVLGYTPCLLYTSRFLRSGTSRNMRKIRMPGWPDFSI